MENRHEETKQAPVVEKDHQESPGHFDIDLTKASQPFHRFKLTAEETALMKRGIELLPKEITKHFQEAHLSLVSKFECTDFFIVMYTSGIKSRRKKRNRDVDK